MKAMLERFTLLWVGGKSALQVVAKGAIYTAFFLATHCWLFEQASVYGQILSRNQVREQERDSMDDGTKAWNIPFPTMGGQQFWTDYRWWNDWKVQYNSTLDHWRLIDPNRVRRAWGGRQAMLEELDKVISKQGGTETPPEHVILLAHGLFRTQHSMYPIADELGRIETLNPDEPKRVCISMAYASTRDPIAKHSQAMRELLEHLPGNPRISFVGHSLGNIVFRHMIGDLQRNGDPTNILGRLDRAVMLGPPNNGSAFAASMAKIGVFETLTGSTGLHLGAAWDKIQSELGVPPCPFAIVIGDISKTSSIQNPFLEGASDGVVTVEEATLEGAAEIKTFPALHSFLMSDEEIVRATISFLRGNSLTP